MSSTSDEHPSFGSTRTDTDGGYEAGQLGVVGRLLEENLQVRLGSMIHIRARETRIISRRDKHISLYLPLAVVGDPKNHAFDFNSRAFVLSMVHIRARVVA